MRKPSLEDLHHDLDETQGIVNILERASRELSTIIDWDEGLRKNPLRHRQLASIGEQVGCANDRKAGIAAVRAKARLLPFPSPAYPPIPHPTRFLRLNGVRRSGNGGELVRLVVASTSR
jgi:hypothetical protein